MENSFISGIRNKIVIVRICVFTILMSLAHASAYAVSFKPVSNNVQAIAIRYNEVWSGTANGLTVWSRIDSSHVTYSQEDGLPHNAIRSLYVDSENAVWAGTPKGVCEWNGTGWIKHDTGIETGDVWSIAEDDSGILWVMTSNGILTYNGTTWSILTCPRNGLNARIRCMAVDHNGVKWFGTSGMGVFCFNDTTWTQFTVGDGLITDVVYSIAVDNDNVKWFGCYDTVGRTPYQSGGLCRFDDTTWETFQARDYFSCDTVMSLATDENNILWIGTYNGLYRWDGSSMTWCFPDSTISPVTAKPTMSVAVFDANERWFGTQNGLYCLIGRTCTRYINNDGMNIDNINQILDDRNNVKWFCSGYGGISSFDGNRWIDHSGDPGLIDCRAWSMAVDDNNVKWFATDVGGLARYDDRSWTCFIPGNSGILSNHVKAVTVDRNNTVWIANREGVQSYDGLTWKHHPLEARFSAGNTFMTVGYDNIVWISIEGGLARFDGIQWEYIRKNDWGFPGDNVSSLHIDADNVLWAGFTVYPPQDNGLWRFDGTSSQTFTTRDGLPDHNVNTIVTDADNTLWIGTSEGIARFNGIDWKLYHDELSDMNVFYSMTCSALDNDNLLWFGNSSEVIVFENGVLKASNGAITSVDTDNLTKPAPFSLANYPNPFNATTTISFTLPSAGYTDITVFSSTGQKIDTLVAEWLSDGTHAVQWNADGIASGIYLYRMTAHGKTVVHKTMFIK